MAYGVLYVLVSAYTRIQRSLGARHSTTYKTRRSRAAESEESFVLPRITRTIRANRDGFTVLFPPTMLQTSGRTSSLRSPLNANATDL